MTTPAHDAMRAALVETWRASARGRRTADDAVKCPECAAEDELVITVRYPSAVRWVAGAMVASHWNADGLQMLSLTTDQLELPVADVECESCGWSQDDVELVLHG